MNENHIVITRNKGSRNQFDLNVYIYRSLSEATRKAYSCSNKDSDEALVQFCIEHPYKDVMSIEEMRHSL